MIGFSAIHDVCLGFGQDIYAVISPQLKILALIIEGCFSPIEGCFSSTEGCFSSIESCFSTN